MKYVLGLLIAGVALMITADSDAGGKPKHTIKEVMKEAHKSKLYLKVADGSASADEKKQLVEMYTSLTQNKPPMGDEKAWKEKTGEMLAAAKKAADGDAKAAASLRKIVTCTACHKMFRP